MNKRLIGFCLIGFLATLPFQQIYADDNNRVQVYIDNNLTQSIERIDVTASKGKLTSYPNARIPRGGSTTAVFEKNNNGILEAIVSYGMLNIKQYCTFAIDLQPGGNCSVNAEVTNFINEGGDPDQFTCVLMLEKSDSGECDFFAEFNTK